MTPAEEILSHHRAQALQPFDNKQKTYIKFLFSVHRLRSRVDFCFALAGRAASEIAKLNIPDLLEFGDRRRRNDLWKNTCFEIFFARQDRSSYLEMNLSPRGDWNIYAFDQYRAGQRLVEGPKPPLTRFEKSGNGELLSWHGSISGGDEIEDILTGPGLVMSATAVLELHSGDHEYWAINHAGTKPDFHLRESFRLIL